MIESVGEKSKRKLGLARNGRPSRLLKLLDVL
jgi:hypothetical protein